MNIYNYNRNEAAAYAAKWATARNSSYYNFDKIGGDCTNFASQCVFAGCKTMNYTKNTGWYYISVNNRAPAWTDAQFLHKFLTNNEKQGPFAENVSVTELEIGDLVQLHNGKEYYHTLVVTGFRNGDILVAAHSADAYMYPLKNYYNGVQRGLHIVGVRK